MPRARAGRRAQTRNKPIGGPSSSRAAAASASSGGWSGAIRGCFGFRGIVGKLPWVPRKRKRAGGEAMPPATPLPGRPVRGSSSGRPIMALLDLLGRRWALRVLWELREAEVPTFRTLQGRCDGASSSVLADRLRELGEAGLVAHDGTGYALTEQ